MTIWIGNSPSKVVFQPGALPSRSAGAFISGSFQDDEEDGEDEEDSDTSDEIDRSLDEDQYRGE